MSRAEPQISSLVGVSTLQAGEEGGELKENNQAQEGPLSEVSTSETAKKRPSVKEKRQEIFGEVLPDGTIIECVYQPEKKPPCSFVVARLAYPIFWTREIVSVARQVL
jgi:hypothetical protein